MALIINNLVRFLKNIGYKIGLFKWRQRIRLKSMKHWRHAAKEPEIRLDYGYDSIPGRKQFIYGGLVKLQDLQTRFPAESFRPNLLYLVSSSLPEIADIQIRAAQRYGGIFVLNQNGVGYPAWHGTGWEKFNRLMAYAHNVADYVIYQSQFCKRSSELFLGNRQGPSKILYNPVDTNVFTPTKIPPSKGPILLIAGTHQFRYRVEIALQTLSIVLNKHPQARLVIAGKHIWASPEVVDKILNKLAMDLRISNSIEWHPPYLQTEAPALLRRAHILLHTQYNDACPRLVVEAMSCGLPVVFSATGGVPELVGKNAGEGVPGPEDYNQEHPPDPKELAKCVFKVWDNFDQYRKAARIHAVMNLDVREWLEEHEIIFLNLLVNRKHFYDATII